MSTDGTTDGHDWTADQAARLRAFRDSGNLCDIAGSHVHESNSKRGVDAEACERWRRLLRADPSLRANAIDADGWSASTVQCHAYGQCDHDPEQVGAAAESLFRDPVGGPEGGGSRE